MKLMLKTSVSLGVLCLTTGAAFAACGIEGSGSVRILSNDFEALRLVNATAEECAAEGVTVTATARSAGQTGVEMEALTATSAALLTIYDMAKALDKGMIIGNVRLLAKSGGKSGDWRAE